MKSSRARSSQTQFQDNIFASRKEFGGALVGRGHAKKARPLSTKHAMHVVLRSSLAKGEWSLRSAKNLRMVERMLRKLAAQYGIRIYKFANVGNHVHLLIKLSNRYTFAPFMRAFAGTIALKVTGANKLSALKEKFWDCIPWSRIVEWGKAYRSAKAYVFQNEMEAAGAVPYKVRSQKIRRNAKENLNYT